MTCLNFNCDCMVPICQTEKTFFQVGQLVSIIRAGPIHEKLTIYSEHVGMHRNVVKTPVHKY